MLRLISLVLSLSLWRLLFGSMVFIAVLGACSQKRAKHPEQDTIVPEDNQKEAQQEYGQQQMMMEDLNQTPSERAGARHDAGIERKRPRKN